MSQSEEILRHLKKKPITAMDALVLYNCFRLAARIKDLRDMGNKILTKTIERNGKKFAQYILIKAKQ